MFLLDTVLLDNLRVEKMLLAISLEFHNITIILNYLNIRTNDRFNVHIPSN